MFVSRLALLPTLLFTTRVPAMPQPADVLSVVPFLSLARELAALLVPVQPRAQFRADLEESLLRAAQDHAGALYAGPYGQEYALGGPFGLEREGLERRWVLGAAAAAAVGSAVSIVGILAYMRRRNERAM